MSSARKYPDVSYLPFREMFVLSESESNENTSELITATTATTATIVQQSEVERLKNIQNYLERQHSIEQLETSHTKNSQNIILQNYLPPVPPKQQKFPKTESSPSPKAKTQTPSSAIFAFNFTSFLLKAGFLLLLSANLLLLSNQSQLLNSFMKFLDSQVTVLEAQEEVIISTDTPEPEFIAPEPFEEYDFKDEVKNEPASSAIPLDPKIEAMRKNAQEIMLLSCPPKAKKHDLMMYYPIQSML